MWQNEETFSSFLLIYNRAEWAGGWRGLIVRLKWCDYAMLQSLILPRDLPSAPRSSLPTRLQTGSIQNPTTFLVRFLSERVVKWTIWSVISKNQSLHSPFLPTGLTKRKMKRLIRWNSYIHVYYFFFYRFYRFLNTVSFRWFPKCSLSPHLSSSVVLPSPSPPRWVPLQLKETRLWKQEMRNILGKLHWNERNWYAS